MTRDQDKPGEVASDIDAFSRMAQQALADIPETLRVHLDTVEMRIEDWPSREMISSLELDSPYDLLGLYEGINLHDKSSFDVMPPPDRIYLFREPILAYAGATGESVAHLVRHVLIHEAGHHFGFSDADMEAIEAEAAGEAKA